MLAGAARAGLAPSGQCCPPSLRRARPTHVPLNAQHQTCCRTLRQTHNASIGGEDRGESASPAQSPGYVVSEEGRVHALWQSCMKGRTLVEPVSSAALACNGAVSVA
eukprot:947218-Rhodomonas_salina.1